ncbi:MAG: hypothetical protein KC416_05280, partial [Myxococcales bacterium]|nr:hypothetical protein [Myxococcales bacterium]
GGGSDGDDVLLYQIPDRSSCATCHGEAPAAVLGVATRQLNGPGNYGRNRTNQIDAMDAIGLFGDTRGPKALAELPRLAGPTDKNASLEERARSYLDTHCAACHQPGGWTSPEITFDLRVETPFAETQLCGERALFPYPANTGDYRIDPGRPDNSNLLGRLSVEGVGEVGEMPPLGRSTVDPVGTALIRDWIRSLEGCPEPDQ